MHVPDARCLGSRDAGRDPCPRLFHGSLRRSVPGKSGDLGQHRVQFGTEALRRFLVGLDPPLKLAAPGARLGKGGRSLVSLGFSSAEGAICRFKRLESGRRRLSLARGRSRKHGLLAFKGSQCALRVIHPGVLASLVFGNLLQARLQAFGRRARARFFAIEREMGSIYKINGRDVRARDVQIFFADASSGAHSPALVRQGQIGQLINAKPIARRAILEEAAGIAGLHARRHEAELKLNAAQQNLSRVGDIVQ
ncbi:MAG: hypothetical protein ACK6A4_07895, partial [Alphaproteobacteria bacterium]